MADPTITFTIKREPQDLPEFARDLAASCPGVPRHHRHRVRRMGDRAVPRGRRNPRGRWQRGHHPRRAVFRRHAGRAAMRADRRPRRGARMSASPDHYQRDGMPRQWKGGSVHTRSDARFGLFFQTPAAEWVNRRTCFPTLDAAITAAAECPAEWRVDHVYDYVRHRIVHVFERVPA